MIGRLYGALLEKNPPHILLETHGVCYEVEVTSGTLQRLPNLGERVMLHTHFVVREDAQLLYGFYEPQEKQLFRNLIKVNNVGPKLAMMILSGMAPEQFARCVIENDTASLVRLPGVGKKTAERLIIEMRDRLASEVPIETIVGPLSTHRSDALKALITLGYKPHEATRAVNKIADEHLTSEEMIKLALQNV
jgi:Holliday junction DNA helicase RuvA